MHRVFQQALGHTDEDRFPLRLIDKLPFAGLCAMRQRSHHRKRSEDTGIRIGIGNPDFAWVATRIASAEKEARQCRGWRTVADKALEQSRPDQMLTSEIWIMSGLIERDFLVTETETLHHTGGKIIRNDIGVFYQLAGDFDSSGRDDRSSAILRFP